MTMTNTTTTRPPDLERTRLAIGRAGLRIGRLLRAASEDLADITADGTARHDDSRAILRIAGNLPAIALELDYILASMDELEERAVAHGRALARNVVVLPTVPPRAPRHAAGSRNA